ncbi:unnamed protein product, partial [Prunus brigantina]
FFRFEPIWLCLWLSLRVGCFSLCGACLCLILCAEIKCLMPILCPSFSTKQPLQPDLLLPQPLILFLPYPLSGSVTFFGIQQPYLKALCRSSLGLYVELLLRS